MYIYSRNIEEETAAAQKSASLRADTRGKCVNFER